MSIVIFYLYDDDNNKGSRWHVTKKNNIYSLQLGRLLLGQQVRHQQIADLKCGFIEVEAQALTAESLGDNVELEARYY